MKEDWTTWSFTVAVELPCDRKRKHEMKIGAEQLAQVPAMYNPEPLQKHVKLTSLFDALMSRQGR
eukprot:4839247-Pyramimonas_sp.AAC.1